MNRLRTPFTGVARFIEIQNRIGGAYRCSPFLVGCCAGAFAEPWFSCRRNHRVTQLVAGIDSVNGFTALEVFRDLAEGFPYGGQQ